MLPESREQIVSRLPGDARVLDVGGWAKPFPRADVVLDAMPHETRGLYGYDGDRAQERFSAGSWVQRDICDREPWPFADGEFDFAVCSHTLEDVRDPVWVCSELQRVARAGYIETPSRLEEQSFGIQGEWVGWGHHHWLVSAGERDIEFVFKHGVLQGRRSAQFDTKFWHGLGPAERVERLWWEGGFGYRERLFVDGDDLDAWLDEVVDRHGGARKRRWAL
ncbi:MAG: class I SAM-dependent methyltransferase [Thermoleophilaceae bacterium]|nr:class I SAM-dependent methyltransferase [Thermoleophilaceae bacterium]